MKLLCCFGSSIGKFSPHNQDLLLTLDEDLKEWFCAKLVSLKNVVQIKFKK
jgi:hypothetical protein